MKCKAHRTDGEPCQAWAISGANVCRVHGGSAPQVRYKAAERMAEVRKQSLDRFLAQLAQDVVLPQTVLNAARDMHIELEKLREREASLANVSVVDEWLAEVYKEEKE